MERMEWTIMEVGRRYNSKLRIIFVGKMIVVYPLIIAWQLIMIVAFADESSEESDERSNDGNDLLIDNSDSSQQ